MSDCEEALDSLYLYLDEELDSTTTAKIRDHLDDCMDCFGSFEFERRLKAVVKDRLRDDIPTDFISRLRAALREETEVDLA